MPSGFPRLASVNRLLQLGHYGVAGLLVVFEEVCHDADGRCAFLDRGDKGSILVPDPNRFGGEVQVARTGEEWQTMPLTHGHVDGEFRSIGVADMATAIVTGRPHRASGALAFHVLEVMEAVQRSSDEGRHITITSQPERPAMLPTNLAKGELD